MLGESATSGNFLIGRPARFPFGGMEENEMDVTMGIEGGNEDVTGVVGRARLVLTARFQVPFQTSFGKIMSKYSEPIILLYKNSKKIVIGLPTSSDYVKTMMSR